MLVHSNCAQAAAARGKVAVCVWFPPRHATEPLFRYLTQRIQHRRVRSPVSCIVGIASSRAELVSEQAVLHLHGRTGMDGTYRSLMWHGILIGLLTGFAF